VTERVEIVGIDHVQLGMPTGGEAAASRFYGTILGLREAAKPPELRERAGILAEEALHGIRVEPLLLAERLEGVEDVRRQDAAEVDEQPFHEREI